MSLRINQNVVALSTYGNLNKTSNRLESSIEKLSSGLRIRRAADDSAGLAISEKMRRQIRGLDRAVLNAQDGVSLIQTAEGALTETQSIIQRMRELALQSANDTLTSNDRLQIQDEINDLKVQIDAIANSTQFNTKKLLNGNQAALVTASTHSVKGIVTGTADAAGDYQVSLSTVSSGVSQVQRSQIFTDRTNGVLATGSTRLQDIAEFYDAEGVFALATTQTLTINGNSDTSSIILDGQMTLNELAAELQQALGSVSGLGIYNSKAMVISEAATGVTGDGGYIQLTSGFVGENGDFAIAASQGVMDALGFSVTRKSINNMISANIQDDYGNSRNITTSNDTAVGLLAGIDLQFTSSPAQIAGNGGMSDGLNFPVKNTFSLKYVTIANVTVNKTITVAAGAWSLQGIARSINTQLANTTGTPAPPDLAAAGFEASIQDGQLRITFNPAVPGQDSNFDIAVAGTAGDTIGLLTGTYNGFVTGEKDKTKEIVGFSKYFPQVTATNTTIVINDDQKPTAIAVTITVCTTVSASTAPDLVEITNWLSNSNTTLEAGNKKVRIDYVNGSLAITSKLVGEDAGTGERSKVTISAATGAGLAITTAALQSFGITQSIAYGSGATNFRVHVVDTRPQFQIGANAGENMRIGIGSMTSQSLGIDRVDLTSVEGAERALEKLNQALDVVSSQRSKLGAYQNRLEYSISNLENTVTNMTAAESRIRDVDIAREMTEYTRNQILAQAGTSMLAQANALPQTALSLLQGI